MSTLNEIRLLLQAATCQSIPGFLIGNLCVCTILPSVLHLSDLRLILLAKFDCQLYMSLSSKDILYA